MLEVLCIDTHTLFMMHLCMLVRHECRTLIPAILMIVLYHFEARITCNVFKNEVPVARKSVMVFYSYKRQLVDTVHGIAVYCENNPKIHKQTATGGGGVVEYLMLKKIVHSLLSVVYFERLKMFLQHTVIGFVVSDLPVCGKR